VSDELSEAKQGARAMWAGGAYEVIGERFAGASAEALKAVDVGAGDKLLDVACGTGNASIPAARAGAEVTGLDLTPRLLDIARERAAHAGVEVEWVEGDAEDLPFEDGTFDAVISVFGSMFAPDQRKAAAELARVLKPGGRLAVAAWTPPGVMGRMFIVTSAHMPDPPEGFKPPILWGDSEHVSQLFEGTGVDLEFERPAVRLEFESLEAAMKEAEETVPPIVAARNALEPEGRWKDLRDDLSGMYEEVNQADGGALVYEAEYLLTKGKKAG
jgi:SAM-dependent methyltransferase